MTSVLTATAHATLGVLVIAIVLAFIRLASGPSLPDRVVALDLIAMLLVGVIAAYSIATGEAVFLRVAMVVALIGFLGTVAFAYYLQLRGHK